MADGRGLRAATLFLRAALGIAFVSAVADRLGAWGPPGTPGVAWGSFESFLAYTAFLSPWAPAAVIPALGWLVTALETLLGLLLILGFQTRRAAVVGGLLLLAFGVSMSATGAMKAALDYSVFSASAGAFLLATQQPQAPSVDQALALRRRNATGQPIS